MQPHVAMDLIGVRTNCETFFASVTPFWPVACGKAVALCVEKQALFKVEEAVPLRTTIGSKMAEIGV